jgi:hypothetical protein
LGGTPGALNRRTTAAPGGGFPGAKSSHDGIWGGPSRRPGNPFRRLGRTSTTAMGGPTTAREQISTSREARVCRPHIYEVRGVDPRVGGYLIYEVI